KRGKAGQSETGFDGLQARGRIGVADTTVHGDAAVPAFRVFEAPPLWFAEVRVDDAVITREVIWRVGHAVLVQIGGRANDDDADGAQPADDQAGICRPTDAYGHIEAFVEQIDHPVREAHVELDIRITGGEGIEGWCKLQDAKGERRRQAK